MSALGQKRTFPCLSKDAVGSHVGAQIATNMYWWARPLRVLPRGPQVADARPAWHRAGFASSMVNPAPRRKAAQSNNPDGPAMSEANGGPTEVKLGTGKSLFSRQFLKFRNPQRHDVLN